MAKKKEEQPAEPPEQTGGEVFEEALLPLVVPMSSLKLDKDNARKHPVKNLEAIKSSLARFGQQKPIVVDRHGIIRAGNGTFMAAKALKWGRIAAVKSNLDAKAMKMFALADNRTQDLSSFDDMILDATLRDIGDMDFAKEMGWTEKQFEEAVERAYVDDAAESLEAEEEPNAEHEAENPVWPGEPTFDVPLLRLDMQAQCVERPAFNWTSVAQSAGEGGTWFFYKDDYRFEDVWDDPWKVVETNPAVCVEPNFSITIESPRAVVLWNTFRKRWLARTWQQKGIRVLVDVNVCEEHWDLAMLGVPSGWKAFGTRVHTERGRTPEQSLDETFERCAKIAGTRDGILFAVFSNSRSIRDHCARRGYTFVPVDGRFDDGKEIAGGGDD